MKNTVEMSGVLMENNPYKQIVFDLVTLALRANNVVVQGQFPGEISEQVSALLEMCKEIHDEYVISDDGSDTLSDRTSDDSSSADNG